MMATHIDPTCLLAAGAGIRFALNVNAAAALEKTLFDFSTVTNPTAWQVVNDDVMGGVSASKFDVANGVASFRGALSLENHGGFASVRSLPARLDLADGDAFVVRVRGDGRRYKFTARTARTFDSPIYQASRLLRHHLAIAPNVHRCSSPPSRWTGRSRNRAGEPVGVYSHETVLSIHDLADANPSKLHMLRQPLGGES